MATKKVTKKTTQKERPLIDVLMDFAKAENELVRHSQFTSDWRIETEDETYEEDGDDCATVNCDDLSMRVYTKIVIVDSKEFEVK